MSAGQADYVEAGALALAIAADLSSGDIVGALKKGRQLVDQLVLMVPVDKLKDDLTETDRRFADLSADVAEEIKLDESK